jgi:hypothetical protein
MRVRIALLAFCLLGLTAFGVLAGPGRGAAANLQDASPAADVTPEAEAAAAGTPEAAPATVNVVTLVAWYTQDPSGEFLNLGPLRTNDNLVAGAGEATDRTLTGNVDFDDDGNDGLPRIVLGESAFNAYPVVDDDPDSVQRWIYLNDDPGLRPATLVLQIAAVKGPYEGYDGTATFISRAPDAGGVLVIVLNPPAE